MLTFQELITVRALVRHAVETNPQTGEVGIILAKLTGMINRTPADPKVGSWQFVPATETTKLLKRWPR